MNSDALIDTSLSAVIVNDSPVYLDVLAKLVIKTGLNPATFHSADEALAGMDHEAPPAIIISDLYMPGIDGWRFCRLLRSPEYPAFNKVPILVVSATFAGEEPHRIAADIGADAFLAAPVDGESFIQHLKRLINAQPLETRRRVLVADEDPALARALHDGFSTRGYFVDTAHTALGAVDCFARVAYDAVILPHHFPDGEGDVLLDTFHAQRPGCACIMTTSDPSPELALDWMKRGAAAYLRKPFAPGYLIELCEKAQRERALLHVQDLLEYRTQELRESENSLLAIINASPESAFLMDTEGRIIHCNEVAARRIGLTVETAIGSNIYERIPPDIAHLRRQRVKQVIQTRRPVHFEDIRTGRHFSHYIHPVLNVQGEVRHLAIFGLDITEHKVVERDLEEQKNLLAAIRQAQSLFISGRDPRQVYQDMLHILIQATGSAYGFLDEVMHDPDGTPYKLSLALSDISWDDDSRRLYEMLAARKLEFRDLDNLSGAPVLDERIIIANDVKAHPRYKGLPPGHPPMNSYMGIPLYFGEELVGVAGVANRPEGYSEEIAKSVEPLTQACASMIWAGRIARRERENRAALEASEEKYRRIAETANEGIWAMDAWHKTTFVNQHMARMLGRQPDEMLGKKVEDFMFPEDLPGHAARMAARHGGAGGVYEHRFRRRDNQEVWTIVSATVIRDGQGDFAGSFAMLTDITDRKRMENDLRESEERFRLISENTSDGIAVISADLKFIYTSPAYLSQIGYTQEEHRNLTMKDVYSLIHPCDIDGVFKTFDESIPEKKESATYSFRLRHKKGHYIWREDHARFIYDDNGHHTITYITCRDVTDRKKSEEALRMQSLVLDQIQDQVIVTTFDGIITYANQAQVCMLGYPKEDLVGKHVTTLGEDPSQGATQRDILERTLLDGSWRGDVVNHAADGSRRVMDARTQVVCDSTGIPMALCGFATDITDRKRMEDVLQRQHTLSTKLNEIMDMTSGLSLSLNEAIYESGMDSGGVYLVNEKNGSLDLAFHQGLPGSFINEIASLPLSSSQARIVQLRQPIYVDFNSLPDELPLYDEDIRSLAVIPIVHDGDVIACMNISSHILECVPDEVRRLLESIASQMGGFIMRARLHEKLRESEETHRALIEGLPDIIMRFDRQGRHLYVCSNVHAIVNIAPSLFIGKTHRELGFPPEQCVFWEESIEGVFNTKTPFEAEFSFEGKDGLILLNWRLVPEYDNDGQVRSVLSISRDITAQRKAEQEYRMLFREMLDGFAVHEILLNAKGKPVDYRFLAINPAFERMTGMKAEETIGKTVLEVLPETEEYWIETYGKVALTGEPVFFVNYSKALGKHFEVTAFRPAPRQFACLFMDVTDRAHSEEEREKLQAQLQQAQKMESIGRLAGGVAHDFNNMLNVILGHAEMALEMTEGSETLQVSLTEILNAAQRSADLTRQLLAFARKQTITPKMLDLNATIEKMLRMLQRLIGEDIELVWKPGVDLWLVKVDPSQIDQILANLCVNARDAITENGKVTIETSNHVFDDAYRVSHPGFESGSFVRLMLTDNGCGMDTETLSRIFEPFYTTKGIGQGTGLGLPMVYGATRQNNGFVDVKSEPGRGTAFAIHLPRYEAVITSPAPAGPSALKRGTETILFVEDEEAVRRLGEMILVRLGYAVLSASTPNEAIRLAEEHKDRIHLLLTDVVMPEMNGRDLASHLLGLYPGIKCLFMSGYTADHIAQHGVLDEGVHFIQKPFTRAALAPKLREALED